jgi:hypothetical protein
MESKKSTFLINSYKPNRQVSPTKAGNPLGCSRGRKNTAKKVKNTHEN